MPAKIKVKRCPFCNSHDLVMDATIIVFFVRCRGCGATGPGASTKTGAAQRWNGRHHHTNPSALVANRKSNHHELKEIE